MSLCTVSGKVFPAQAGVEVRARFVGSAVVKEGETPNGGEILTASRDQKTETDSSGDWSIDLQRAVAIVGGVGVEAVRVTVPKNGFDDTIEVPDLATELLVNLITIE